jgi:hypothetical protein
VLVPVNVIIGVRVGCCTTCVAPSVGVSVGATVGVTWGTPRLQAETISKIVKKTTFREEDSQRNMQNSCATIYIHIMTYSVEQDENSRLRLVDGCPTILSISCRSNQIV